MVASAVLAAPLAAQSNRLGDAYFLAIGPAVIFVALIAWVTIVLTTSRKRHHYPSAKDGLPHRGPVMGGVIMGSPSQRTRRDPAPSVTHREVMAHIEQGRAEEEARERERAEAERIRARPPAGNRRRFGLPRLR
ncbi:hypothetical protein BKA00_006531 [Actinomadura coerulea]|uniref:Uncharacterized protein n=1 Tax=Actinomadura coerulea TaxID=46159 RepID=A0A7X0L2K6_9ACTN|nr:hypothetical protein [Actinomadura coerulea]MBB6399617.1 hypothetical protein [Actinomadura coerulea]GGQ12456.1 hypothetical protein GCM10010187_30840 [Actinomadura coerulea]